MSKFPLGANCFVTSITLAAVRRFGDLALEWDPLVLRDGIEHALLKRKMPQRMFDKLNAGITMIATGTYTTTIEGFLMCTSVMNNKVVDEDHPPFCTLKECAWGVTEYMNLLGDMDEQGKPTETFSPDIIAYIQEAGKLNGVTKFPNCLKFAEGTVAMPELTIDPVVFSQYMARQDEYAAELDMYVQGRQKLLAEELKLLESGGFVG